MKLNVQRFIQCVLIGALIGISGVSIAGQAAVAQCHYTEVDPAAGKFSAGAFKVDLGPGDGDPKPTAWTGPITIAQQGGASCPVDQDVSIVERPVYTDGRHLLVSTYSGSEQRVFALDASSCKVLWKSESFSGRVKLTGNRLHLDRQTVKLQANCVP